MESCQLLATTSSSSRSSSSRMEAEEEAFFDTREELLASPAPSPAPALPWSSGGLDSVRERKERFLRSMGLECSPSPRQADPVCAAGVAEEEEEEVVPDTGRFSSQSEENDCSMSSWSTEETTSYGDGASDDNSVSGSSKDDGSKVSRSSSSFSFIKRLMSRNGKPSRAPRTVERRRSGWFERLGVAACVVDHAGDEPSTSSSSDSEQTRGGRYERIKVRSYRKRSKELSAMYQGQVIKAHDGAILTMKFSPDGQFLASSGEDGVVRVWGVSQSDDCKIPLDDPSCVYLKVRRKNGLAPVSVDNAKISKVKSMKKTRDSACIVIPAMAFQISEEPLHEFYGHSGDVLDLSWSNNKHLLSASTDKTVRLWEIGSTNCISVFSHSNFVTCVQFNPTNDNCFITGSIDGKVRVWDITRGSVVDWVDVRDIVTAVCYRPDGKLAVVGTITGNCRFYDASENLLRLETHIQLNAKKSSFKRITSFEFCPSNPSKLMVTSADSKIRILDGTNVIQNYSGLRSGSCQMSASFTPDGQHIVSASEDSNIYVWNRENQDESVWRQAKTTYSSERFQSNNAAIAIPWNGIKLRSHVSLASQIQFKHSSSCGGDYSSSNSLTPRSAAPGIFNLNQELFNEPSCKGASATWPEELLPSFSIGANLDESQYKLLRNCSQGTSNSWGRVIVTAGWDGRIRSFQNYGLPVHQ